MSGKGKSLVRTTKETRVEVRFDPAGGPVRVSTGLGFLDHMLSAWAFHGGFGLDLTARGDLAVDAHHTVEDTALALGEAVDLALGSREGIARFGWALVPLDEALSRAAVDLCRRPYAVFSAPVLPERIGDFPSEMAPHLFRSLASAGRFTLHVEVLRAENGHHALESAFKAVALAMAQAIRPAQRGPRSTKGVL
jgi:imidazoleglycerol-phosphate dehydratase